jgi:hypothetical protein
MKVLVCGDRKLQDHNLVNQTLDKFNLQYNFTEVIEGEATGADTLAREWAKSHHIPVKAFPALWERYGYAAGPIRNTQMLVEGCPELVIAFLSEGSKGTRNMINQSQKAGLPIIVIDIKENRTDLIWPHA